MTQREAKRLACRMAAEVLSAGPVPEDPAFEWGEGPDHDRVESAWHDLCGELRRRGRK